MPISRIAGTRIEFLRSLSIGLRTNDSGVDPDLKQKMIGSHFDVDDCPDLPAGVWVRGRAWAARGLPMPDTQVLIVGAGPTGLVLALWLNGAGLCSSKG